MYWMFKIRYLGMRVCKYYICGYHIYVYWKCGFGCGHQVLETADGDIRSRYLLGCGCFRYTVKNTNYYHMSDSFFFTKFFIYEYAIAKFYDKSQPQKLSVHNLSSLPLIPFVHSSFLFYPFLIASVLSPFFSSHSLLPFSFFSPFLSVYIFPYFLSSLHHSSSFQ